MLRRMLEKSEFPKGLGFRLGGLLSVAILPIGLISVIQTLHLSREYERSSEIALLGRTATAAAAKSSRAAAHTRPSPALPTRECVAAAWAICWSWFSR